jgi:hypothetical protein
VLIGDFTDPLFAAALFSSQPLKSAIAGSSAEIHMVFGIFIIQVFFRGLISARTIG